jgi:hypothetical protein
MVKTVTIQTRWDAFVIKESSNICVEEILVHNRWRHCLNGVVYANLVRKYYKCTKRPYSKEQIKNKWIQQKISMKDSELLD